MHMRIGLYPCACLLLSEETRKKELRVSGEDQRSVAYRVANLQGGQLGHHRSIWHARIAANHHRDATGLHLVHSLRFV